MVVIIDTLAPRLMSWNLEKEEGVPLPATRESLEEMDMEYLFKLFTSFMEVVGELPKVLKPELSNSPIPVVDESSPGA